MALQALTASDGHDGAARPEPLRGPLAEPVSAGDAALEPLVEPADAPPQDGLASCDSLLLCLAYLTRYFDQPVSAAEIARLYRGSPGASRGASPGSPPGSLGGRVTPQIFRLLAQRLGYRTSSHKASPQRLQEAPLPFMLLDRDGLAPRLVIDRSEHDLFLYDPLSGDRDSLAVAQLGDAERLISVRPQSEPAATDWRGLLRRRLRGALRELLLASLLINLFALVPPLFLFALFGRTSAFGAADLPQLLLAGLLAVYGSDALLQGIRGAVARHSAARFDALLSAEVVQRLLRLPYRHFETTSTGVIGERLRQLDVIRGVLAGEMPLVLIDLGFVVLFLGALFAVSGGIAWIAAASLPLFLALSLASARRQRRLAEQTFESQAAKSSILAETLGNAVTIKSLGLEAEIARRWSERLAQAAAVGLRARALSNLAGAAGSGLQHLALLVMVVVGARAVIAGELSLGALLAALLLAARALAPARKAVAAWAQLQELRGAFRRLEAIMAAAPPARSGHAMPRHEIAGTIELQDVTLQVAPERPPVLRDVSLRIEAGSVVAVVGPSGSGKSTLVRAMQGLYRPLRGRVLIDGIEIRHIAPGELHAQIAVVPQEVQLFAGTIGENIAFGLNPPDPARVVAAAKFVGAHDFIAALPEGYETRLQQGGLGLSAGQRQLIAIARALIRNPRILILDEATSALDRDAERHLMANLKRAGRGRTIIMVSHRPAPAAIATQVLRVADGGVAPLSLRPLAPVPRIDEAPNEAPGQAAGEAAADGARLDDMLPDQPLYLVPRASHG